MSNKLLNKFQNFMAERNGGDQLSLALLLLSLALSIISRLSDQPILTLLSYIPFVWAVFRMFSKNLEKRRLENYKFMMKISPIYTRFYKAKSRFKARKTYKYFKCPQCRQGLRVPRGKGKINITCSKCGTTFMKKS